MFVALVVAVFSAFFVGQIFSASPSVNQQWQSVAGDASGQYVMAVASYGQDYAYLSSDYGATYTQLGSALNYWQTCDATYDMQTMYIGSSSVSGVFQRSTDGGATFTTVGSGTINYISGLATDKNSGRYVVVACWSASKMFYSSDYGQTFTQYATNGKYSSVAASDDGSYFFIAFYNSGSIGSTYSTDFGVTWTSSDLPVNKPWRAISCSSTGQFVATVYQSSGAKVYLSSDYGVTFSQLANSPTGSQMLAVGMSRNLNSYNGYTLVTGDTNTQKAWYSLDTGATWIEASNSNIQPRFAYVNNAGTTAVVATNTYMYYSNSSGASYCISSASSSCNQVFGNSGSSAPTASPVPSVVPTYAPTAMPSFSPTMAPSTPFPTTSNPTFAPTAMPSFSPTMAPTETPTVFPTSSPSSMPTVSDMDVIGMSNSGYFVGMASKTIFPVITIGPVLVLLIFALVFCWFSPSCCKSSNEENEPVVSLSTYFPTMLYVAVFFSIVQFSVTLSAYAQFIHPWVGSWWIAIFVWVALIVNFMISGASSFKMHLWAMFFTFAAWMAALICTVGDALFYTRVLRTLETCYNQKQEYFGNLDAEYIYGIQTCIRKYDHAELTCTSRHNNRCYFFDGNDNGNFLLHRYTHLMEAGVVFDIVILVVMFLLWILQMYGILASFSKKQSPTTNSKSNEMVDVSTV